MQDKAATPPSPKELCRDDLRRRILTRALPPGAELDENGIALEYGLSRTPLREVFQTLAAHGYLSSAPNRGTRVAPLDTEALRALVRSFPVLLVTSARIAAQDANDAAGIAALAEAFANAEDDSAAALAAHETLSALGDAPGNAYLRPALDRSLIDYTRLTLPLYSAGSKKDRKGVKKAGQTLSALAAAVQAGDEAAAAEAATTLWDAMRARLERYLHPEAPPIPDLPEPVEA